MEQKPLYMEDNYMKEFDAIVKEVNQDKFIVLDNTAFYPNSGGQPHDTGKLITESGEEYDVVYVGKFSGQISHEVDKKGLKQGDKVKGVINWERRYKLMRSHTASHILCSIFHKEAGALITGNQLDVDKSRVDFSLENFDRDRINEYVMKTNEIIKKGLDIKTYFLKKDEAMKIPGIVKLAGALPPDVEELRIVEIKGVDIQADGGTHVKNTKEINGMKIVKMDNKGKNNRRIYFELVE